MISLMFHNISCYKVRVSTGVVETRWLGGSFLMVYRKNAGRLGSGFISVCLETRWLGQKSGFYVPERPCTRTKKGKRGGEKQSHTHNHKKHLGEKRQSSI